jgi:CBS domain-containing protein
MSNEPSGKGSGDDYQDPLENYDPKTYKDPLEHALAEETVEAIQSQPYVAVPPNTTIAEVMGKLVDLNIACVLIEDEGKLTGVFSERDALNKIALEYDEVKDKPVSDFMTTSPIYVYNTDSSAAALSVMAATGFRHVPVVDLDEKLVGVVSPSRVTAFLQTYLTQPKE